MGKDKQLAEENNKSRKRETIKIENEIVHKRGINIAPLQNILGEC